MNRFPLAATVLLLFASSAYTRTKDNRLPGGLSYSVVYRPLWPEGVRLSKNDFQSTMLIVDQDQNIRLLYERPLDLKKGKILGQAITRSGDLSLARYIGKNEVAFRARRVTLGEDLRVHVVLTWGPMEGALAKEDISYEFSPVAFILYVLKQKKREVTVQLREAQSNQLLRLVVDDVNKDGEAEIVITAARYRGTWMKLWRITGSGNIEKVAFGGEMQSPSLYCLSDDKPCDIVTERGQNLGDRILRTREYYRWDPQGRRYTRRSVVTVEERTVEEPTTGPDPPKR